MPEGGFVFSPGSEGMPVNRRSFLEGARTVNGAGWAGLRVGPAPGSVVRSARKCPSAIALLLLVFFLHQSAFGVTYYVRFNGRDQCNGRFDADHNGDPLSFDCAWQHIDKCNKTLAPGDECVVEGGHWYVRDTTEAVVNRIRPSNPLYPGGGQGPNARISYLCPSQDCFMDGAGSCIAGEEIMDLRNRRWIVVDGFRFHDGTVHVWGYDPITPGTPSESILLTNITATDNDPIIHVDSCQAVLRGSGGIGNSLTGFNVDFPPAIEIPGPPLISTKQAIVQLGTDLLHPETGTTLRNGAIRGGWNGLSLKRCDSCVVDGVIFEGQENHVIELTNGGGTVPAIVRNLEIRNSIILPSSAFRERSPQILATLGQSDYVENINFLNNAFLGGLAPLPIDRCDGSLRGTVNVYNNIFYGGGKSDALEKAQMVLTDCNTTTPPVTWNLDYNAYFGAGSANNGRYAGVPTWHDLRYGVNQMYYADYDSDGVPGCTTGCPPLNLAFGNWKALGFDTHSLVRVSEDYRPSTAALYKSPLWGLTAPFSGAMVDCEFSATQNSFDTNDSWGDSLTLGDMLYYPRFNLHVSVTGFTSVVPPGCPGGATRVTFAPPFPAGKLPSHGEWFWSYGPSGASTQVDFSPQPGSPVIDAGDNAHCGHIPEGAACEIGPVELTVEPYFLDLTGDTILWSATSATPAVYNLYRGDLDELFSTGIYTQDPVVVPEAAQACGLPGTSFNDTFVPQPGRAAFFIVTVTSGSQEGTLGKNGAGSNRPNDNPCP